MKKKFFYVLLFLFITGCNKTNVVNQPLLNFSDEKSSNNLAEIYTFPDGTKVYSEFANIEFVISDERVDLYDGFKLGKITIDEIISKMCPMMIRAHFIFCLISSTIVVFTSFLTPYAEKVCCA